MKLEMPLKLPTAAEIADRISKIGDDLADVAHDIVAVLDVNPKFADELQEHGVPREFIRRLELFGRDQVDRRLVFADSPGARKLLNLPLSEQKVALDEGIEILEDDGQDKRVIPVHELTPKQAQQAFNGTGKRTPAQQRTWLKEQKAKAMPAASYGKDYRVFKDTVETKVPGRWPKSLILEWLSQMS